MNTRQTRKHGFTLIEMLVVIAIIALLASFIVPAVTEALNTAKKTQVMANGRSIHQAIFSTITDIGGAGINFYPEETSTNYTNSTTYFAWLMRDFDDTPPGQEVLTQDFKLYTADGIPVASDLADFIEDGENNIWSTVTGLSASSEASAPFLVTRNLNQANLVDWGTDETSRPANVGTGTYEKPYEEDTVIVIRSGGGGDILNRNAMFWKNINPTNLDNAILAPGTVP